MQFMVDMAMHMMDIAQNSIRAEAKNINIVFNEDSEKGVFSFSVNDDGIGMSEEDLRKITDPFFTTRSTRKVGLGIPFLKMSCEQTGGYMRVTSDIGKGTMVEAVYNSDSPDCLPLGDIAGCLALLVRANKSIRVVFNYRIDVKAFNFDSDELRNIGVDLTIPDMTALFKTFLKFELNEVFKYRSTKSMLC